MMHGTTNIKFWKRGWKTLLRDVCNYRCLPNSNSSCPRRTQFPKWMLKCVIQRLSIPRLYCLGDRRNNEHYLWWNDAEVLGASLPTGNSKGIALGYPDLCDKWPATNPLIHNIGPWFFWNFGLCCCIRTVSTVSDTSWGKVLCSRL